MSNESTAGTQSPPLHFWPAHPGRRGWVGRRGANSGTVGRGGEEGERAGGGLGGGARGGGVVGALALTGRGHSAGGGGSQLIERVQGSDWLGLGLDRKALAGVVGPAHPGGGGSNRILSGETRPPGGIENARPQCLPIEKTQVSGTLMF